MNKQELIEYYEKILDYGFLSVAEEKIYTGFVEKLKQLDEPQSIKLKDIISRMEGLSEHTRSEWLNDILYKFGSDYGTFKYKDGYEQGKFEASMIPFFENDKTRCVCGYAYDFYLEDEDATIMQSTGLKDKNGKEIFEGDIITNGQDVMCMKRHNTLGFYLEQKEKVEFLAGDIELDGFEECAEEVSKMVEIIGNIYENPELLEVE